MESAQDSLNSVRNAATTASGALQVLQGRADEAGDEISSAGRSAGTTGSTFGVLSASTSGLSASFGILSTSTLGLTTSFTGLAVAAGTLLTALAPIAVTLGGIATAGAALAGVFGTIIGTGILAFGEKRGKQNQKRLKEVNKRINRLQKLKETETSVTSAQQRRYEFLIAIKDANGTLSKQQQEKLKRLQKLKEKQFELTEAQEFELDKLKAIKEQSGALTDAQEEQLAELKELKNENIGLTQTQEKELEQLKERKKELEEQTGIMGGLKDAMSELKEELAGIVTEFGEQFIPLIEDAIDAIPDLVRNIFAAMGGMEEFTNTLREMGQIVFNIIPDFVAFMFDLARSVLPIVNNALDSFRQNGDQIGNIISGLSRIISRTLPVLVEFGKSLINISGPILRFGTRVARVVVPALTGFVNFLSEGLTTANQFFSQMEGSGGALSGFADTLKSIFSDVSGFLSAMIVNIRQWLGKSRNQKRIASALSVVGDVLGDLFSNAGDVIGTFVDQVGIWLGKEKNRTALGKAFDAIVEAIRTNLDNAIARLTGWLGNSKNQQKIRVAFRIAFGVLGDVLEDIMQEFINYVENGDFQEDLERAGQVAGETFANAFIGGMKGLKDSKVSFNVGGRQVQMPLFQFGAIGGGEGAPPTTLSDEELRQRTQQARKTRSPLERLFVATVEGLKGAKTGGFIQSGGMAMLHQGERVVPSAQVTDRGQVQVDASSGPIEVVVKGDTGVIEEVTARKMNEVERRQRRNSGRTTNITRG